MALEATAPVSFPVPKENEPVRRRAVFSHSVRGAESHHALSPDDAAAIRTRRRRKTNEDSLQLIDDLVNRPMDPMFSDSRLVHEHRSTFSIWFNRIVVFIICVGVGFACSLFVQQLQSDPRKQVRQTLATQLENRNSQIDELTTDVNNLRSQVDEQSKKISGSVKSDTLIQDEMVNGATVVEAGRSNRGKPVGSILLDESRHLHEHPSHHRSGSAATGLPDVPKRSRSHCHQR